jgi:lysophospholipase L1-like esterase
MDGSTSLLFIGDSLTEWFDWQARFPSYRVTNLGVAGESVEGLLGRLDWVRSRMGDARAIFLMTGINNIATGHHDILRAYREVAFRLRGDFPKAVLVIQSVLPVNLPGTDNSVIARINERLERIAAESRARYLDLYGVFIDHRGNPRLDYLLDDGVHVSAEGYRAWADEVEKLLERAGFR